MEALQVLTTAVCMAFTVGPLIGLVTLVAYRILLHIGRRGFTVNINVPKQERWP